MENNYIKASCICGQSTRTFLIKTKEVEEDLNTPCTYCGTKLNINNKSINNKSKFKQFLHKIIELI